MKPQIKLEHYLVSVNNETTSINQNVIDTLVQIKEPCDISFFDNVLEFSSGTCLRTLCNVRLTGLEVVVSQVRTETYDAFLQKEQKKYGCHEEMKIIGFSAKRDDSDASPKYRLVR